jgi:hypothetical protein
MREKLPAFQALLCFWLRGLLSEGLTMRVQGTLQRVSIILDVAARSQRKIVLHQVVGNLSDGTGGQGGM